PSTTHVPIAIFPPLTLPRPPSAPLFPYTTLFRSHQVTLQRLELLTVFQTDQVIFLDRLLDRHRRLWLFDHRRSRRRSRGGAECRDRKSTRLNSSHVKISDAVFCWQKTRSAASHQH